MKYDAFNARFSPQGNEQFKPRALVVVDEDIRFAQLIALYNRLDERGKNTLLRMAAAMPGKAEG